MEVFDTVSQVRVAAAQFFSGTDVGENLEICRGWMRRAHDAGSQLLVLPENSNRYRGDFTDRAAAWKLSEDIGGDFIRGLQISARELGLHVAVGVDLRGAVEPDVHIGSVLIGADGEIIARYHKHILWDYEYTLFVPGTEPYRVYDTAIGRIAPIICADGIVPDTPRCLGLLGAQIFVNSLNSRGPDEVRVHVPLRAIENHVWHVSANTVGGPPDGYPWTGGSLVVAPDGTVLARASETNEEMIVADIDPSIADQKKTTFTSDLFGMRRPDLYGPLLAPVDSLPVAGMYGPAPTSMPTHPVNVALLQVSHYHHDDWTVTRALGQVEYAARRGAGFGVFPELFPFERGSVDRDPGGAADRSARILSLLQNAAATNGIVLAASLVERAGEDLFHSAYLIEGDGSIAGVYRKAHLDDSELRWATPGSEVVVVDSSVGRVGLMIGNEVWIPEMARLLTLAGAEMIAHPCDWDRPEAAHVAATERTEENRVHLVSCARLDNVADVGSQITQADEFIGGAPVALMRFPTAYWTRTGFEEQLMITLDLRESHSKIMGLNLDPVATRTPELYGPLVQLR